MNRLLSVLALLSFCYGSFSAPKPMGNPNAFKGGTFTIGYPSYPKDLLAYLSNDETAVGINNLILQTLLDTDPITNDFIPLLASAWKESDDKMNFTFTLDPKAQFSDGKPVTAEDIKFTWDTIMNPKNKTAPYQAVYSSIESCTVVNPQTVTFKAKVLHFKNLEKLAGLMVLPKHFFSGGDFNRAFHTKILGSGPYTLEEIKQGEKITLKRNPNFWGAQLYQNIGRFNFDKIIFRVVEDYDVQFEMFKKGDLDYFYFLSAKLWSTQTDSTPFKNNWIAKLKGEHKIPSSFQGVAWNLRRPLFKDKKVRWALSHLYNRDRWMKELFYDNYTAVIGLVSKNSEFISPKLKPIPYNPARARELLKEAGWTQVGEDGILVKDGVRFEFDLLEDNQSSLRYLTLYQEDLKKAGIKANIRVVDWATCLKLMDDGQFDGHSMALGRDADPGDFNAAWGTDQADLKGSSNRTGYKNPQVDTLAKQIDQTFDKKKRIKLVQQLDEIVTDDQPITYSWELNYFRVGYWNRFGFPGKGYFPYSGWKDAFHYWWADAEKDKKLSAARTSNKKL